MPNPNIKTMNQQRKETQKMCLNCCGVFVGTSNKLYCQDLCRKTAHRLKKNAA